MERAHTIYCPLCEWKQKIAYDVLYQHETVICKKCKLKFNTYTVYQSLYDNISIAKMIADIWSQIIYHNFSVKYNTNALEKSKIEIFLNKNNFSKLLPQIVKDIVVFGDSFLQYQKTDNAEILLERIKIANMEVCIHTRHLDYLFDFIDKDGKTIENDKVIHFEVDSFFPPFGESVYGYWFHTWNYIREHFKLLNLHVYRDRNVQQYDALNRIRQMFEKETIMGSGLAIFIFNRYLIDNPTTPFNVAFLKSEARTKRDSIQNTIERKIFPLVLGREWDVDNNFPEFIITGKLDLDNYDHTKTDGL